jgi:predicted transcriptional regulator
MLMVALDGLQSAINAIRLTMVEAASTSQSIENVQQSGNSVPVGVTYIELTTDIVVAYPFNKSLHAANLSKLTGSIGETFGLFGRGQGSQRSKAGLVPATPIETSIAPILPVSLDDGRRRGPFKRDLANAHDLTADEYCAGWRALADYPTVALNDGLQCARLARKAHFDQSGESATRTKVRQQ